jgi:UDP-glucose 4-epimerase
VVVFDNLQQGHRAAVPAEVEFVEGDLASHTALDRLSSTFRFDAILNLVRAATDNGVRKFVLSSTANLFGMPDRMPINAFRLPALF